MNTIKALGSGIKNFMIIFSFIVNLVLVVIVVGLLLFIFDIKNNIVTPLVSGLHSSFVGLNEATIDWTIPVRDRIPVVLNIPLQTDTVVTLTDSVPLAVAATINLPGVGTLNNAQVFLQLPEGLELPVALDLQVPVDEELDIALDVRAVIPLSQTQLADPFENLRLLFEPITLALYNLPGDFAQAGNLFADIVAGRPINLLAQTANVPDPWPGFARTAGLGYDLAFEPVPLQNQPVETGIIPQGGIPGLDEQIRPEVWEAGGPAALNAQAADAMSTLGVEDYTFNGEFSGEIQAQAAAQAPAAVPIPATPSSP
ncbi:MAG: hypothetical protein SF162_15595 [bacterium]|nr:hypothetical protein [bacterium]